MSEWRRDQVARAIHPFPCGDTMNANGWEMRCTEPAGHNGRHGGPAVNVAESSFAELEWAHEGEPGDPTLRIEDTGRWANGQPLTDEDRRYIALLRAAGCECLWPLLGYQPGVGPRCRLCDALAGQS